MNAANVAKLITFLEARKPNQIRMNHWLTDSKHTAVKEPNCGTFGCIGGWAEALAAFEIQEPRVAPPAQHWLGLTNEQASNLFYMEPGYLGDVKFDQALFRAYREGLRMAFNRHGLGDQCSLMDFDELRAATRKTIVLNVLRHLLLHNKVDWAKAMNETPIMGEVEEAK